MSRTAASGFINGGHARDGRAPDPGARNGLASLTALKMRWPTLLLLLSLFSAASLAALPEVRRGELALPENVEVRRAFERTVTGAISTVLAVQRTEVGQTAAPHAVRFEVQQQPDHVYLLFLNQRRHLGRGSRASEFPIAGAGSWVIRRNRADGSFEQVKVFLADHPDFFVRVFPNGERSTMDVILAGDTVYRDVPVPLAFREILRRPFGDVMRAAAAVVDWSLFAVPPNRGEYRAVESIVRRIRPELSSLPDAEDGAMDRHGNLVSIDTAMRPSGAGFNCSGFAKWVVDGLYQPRTGEYLDIEQLKTRHPAVRGHGWSDRLEDERDPYFGLDWSRNLALAMKRLAFPDRELAITAADVGSLPFSQTVPNIGFSLRELNRVLYLLALREPGYFYIGSVNREFGREPVLRQHVHVALFFPYFDAHGRFQVVVMERNVETSVASLQRRYGDGAVHLVRVRAAEPFVPPAFTDSSFIEYSPALRYLSR